MCKSKYLTSTKKVVLSNLHFLKSRKPSKIILRNEYSSISDEIIEYVFHDANKKMDTNGTQRDRHPFVFFLMTWARSGSEQLIASFARNECHTHIVFYERYIFSSYFHVHSKSILGFFSHPFNSSSAEWRAAKEDGRAPGAPYRAPQAPLRLGQGRRGARTGPRVNFFWGSSAFHIFANIYHNIRSFPKYREFCESSAQIFIFEMIPLRYFPTLLVGQLFSMARCWLVDQPAQIQINIQTVGRHFSIFYQLFFSPSTPK